jgi:succinoglycan biosynthesis protein ExoO
MFRAGFLESKGIRYAEDIMIGEDYQLCMECLLDGARFVVTSESYYKYRMRPGSLSWRLQVSHVQRLLQAHEALQLEKRFGKDAELREAARAYADALRKAEVALGAIEDAKAGCWQRAMLSAATHPAVWSILLRFASQAATKRLATSPR